jgi:penicillin-binding protein 1C
MADLRHGRVVSGGSTLTMQVARLLEPREERTPCRQGTAGARAWQLEAGASKATILDYYLTLAPYGGNIEGVRAAALSLFRQGAEAAVPGRRRRCWWRCRRARKRGGRTGMPPRRGQARDRVLDLAAARGAISPEADADAARPTRCRPRKPFPMHAPHAAEAALKAEPAAAHATG